MISATLSPEKNRITVEDVISALQRVPSHRWADILQFIEFVEYQTALTPEDPAEDEVLWAAVEAEQAYRQEHPEDIIVCRSIDELKAVLDSDE